MAPPRKLNAERTTRIVEAILAGARLEVAARNGGIAPSTHFDWAAKGEAVLAQAGGDLDAVEDIEAFVYAEYATKIDEARRRWELGQLALIQRSAQGQPWEVVTVTEKVDAEGRVVERTTITKSGVKTEWQAAAWTLERRLPKHYTRVSRTELTGEDGGPIEMSMDDLVARGEKAIDELAARRDRAAG